MHLQFENRINDTPNLPPPIYYKSRKKSKIPTANTLPFTATHPRQLLQIINFSQRDFAPLNNHQSSIFNSSQSPFNNPLFFPLHRQLPTHPRQLIFNFSLFIYNFEFLLSPDISSYSPSLTFCFRYFSGGTLKSISLPSPR